MTTPPTQGKTREEWKADVSLCALVGAKHLCRARDHGEERSELAAYRLQRDTIIDSIISLQASATSLQAENQELRAEVERMQSEAPVVPMPIQEPVRSRKEWENAWRGRIRHFSDHCQRRREFEIAVLSEGIVRDILWHIFRTPQRLPKMIQKNTKGDRCPVCDGTNEHYHAYDDDGELPGHFDGSDWVEKARQPK